MEVNYDVKTLLKPSQFLKKDGFMIYDSADSSVEYRIRGSWVEPGGSERSKDAD
jgi:hypothetical protein